MKQSKRVTRSKRQRLIDLFANRDRMSRLTPPSLGEPEDSRVSKIALATRVIQVRLSPVFKNPRCTRRSVELGIFGHKQTIPTAYVTRSALFAVMTGAAQPGRHVLVKAEMLDKYPDAFASDPELLNLDQGWILAKWRRQYTSRNAIAVAIEKPDHLSGNPGLGMVRASTPEDECYTILYSYDRKALPSKKVTPSSLRRN